MMKLTVDGQDQLDKGELDAARRTLDTVIKTDPTFFPAYFVRARLLFRQHKYDEALLDCNEALRGDSTFAEAALLRASINRICGRYAESLKEINHVISIRPRRDAYARAYNERAWLHLTCPDPAFRNEREAVKDATLACKLMNWKDEETIDTLARAHAKTGDFDSAVRFEEKALKIKGISAKDAKALQRNLDLFKQHRTAP
jgi:tetratricopeptide (TPR) repeat protein